MYIVIKQICHEMFDIFGRQDTGPAAADAMHDETTSLP